MGTFQVSITDKCNANCPFCISKMTYRVDHDTFNWDNLEEACQFAKEKGMSVAKITGKWGEPLKVPERITKLLPYLHDFEVELQTNAKEALFPKCKWSQWKDLGLNIISISSVHWDASKNRLIYGKNYPDLNDVIDFLKTSGYKTRLGCLLIEGWIDSPEKVSEFINKFPKVDQISFIPVETVQSCPQSQLYVEKWINNHKLIPWKVFKIIHYLNTTYEKIRKTCYSNTYLHEEKTIYIADCLKIPPPEVGYRHLIYFPDGTLRYSWEDPNSIVNTRMEE